LTGNLKGKKKSRAVTFGFRQHHRRCTVTGRWTWCNYYLFYVWGGWGWGRL